MSDRNLLLTLVGEWSQKEKQHRHQSGKSVRCETTKESLDGNIRGEIVTDCILPPYESSASILPPGFRNETRLSL